MAMKTPSRSLNENSVMKELDLDLLPRRGGEFQELFLGCLWRVPHIRRA